MFVKPSKRSHRDGDYPEFGITTEDVAYIGLALFAVAGIVLAIVKGIGSHAQ